MTSMACQALCCLIALQSAIKYNRCAPKKPVAHELSDAKRPHFAWWAKLCSRHEAVFDHTCLCQMHQHSEQSNRHTIRHVALSQTWPLHTIHVELILISIDCRISEVACDQNATIGVRQAKCRPLCTLHLASRGLDHAIRTPKYIREPPSILLRFTAILKAARVCAGRCLGQPSHRRRGTASRLVRVCTNRNACARCPLTGITRDEDNMRLSL